MPVGHKFLSPSAGSLLLTSLRWAGLLLATLILAHLMNVVASGYFAYGGQAEAPVQAEVSPTVQPPVDWLPVAIRPGMPHIAVPPDRAADNRVAEDGS
jgi:hypothetical protein